MKRILALLPAALIIALAGCAGPKHEANVGGLNSTTASTKTSSTPTVQSAPATKTEEPQPIHKDMAKISTKFGDIIIELDSEAAPLTVANFKKLASEGFYNGTTFHRVIPGFMIQGGDPLSKDTNARGSHGTGGPGYTVPAEIKLPHRRGTIATARLGDTVNPKRESSGSQFFICVADTPFLDNQYTAFGHVVSGIEIADKIVSQKRDARDNPVEPITMTVTVE